MRPVNIPDRHLPLNAGWFIAAYRLVGGRRRIDEDDENSSSFATPAPREERTASLFNISRLTPIREWLVDLEFRRLTEKKPAEKDRADAVFDRAKRAIESIFPNNVVLQDITPTKDIRFEGKRHFGVHQHSFGRIPRCNELDWGSRSQVGRSLSGSGESPRILRCRAG